MGLEITNERVLFCLLKSTSSETHMGLISLKTCIFIADVVLKQLNSFS